MKPRVLCSTLVLAATITSGSAIAGEEGIRLADAPGRDATVGRCIVCHSLDYIEMNAPVQDRAGWQKTIRKMIDRFGAPISDDEAALILDYLADNYSAQK